MTDRQQKQLKAHRKLIRELKQDISKSYQMKVLHDAYYQKVDFKESVDIII